MLWFKVGIKRAPDGFTAADLPVKFQSNFRMQ